MRRRRFLATGTALLAGAFAGCAHSNAALTMDAVDDRELAERASAPIPEEDNEYRRIVEATVENGTATANGTYPPIEPDRTIAHAGAYYEVRYTVTGSRTVDRYTIEVDFDPESTDGPTIAFEDLPAVDRQALSGLLPPGEDHPSGEGPDAGVARTYSDAEQADSVLVPTSDYEFVSYEGTSYGVAVGESRTVEIEQYRYTAERVATSTADFGRQIRDRYLFVLDGLSGTERELVEKAIDDGYYSGSGSDAFRSVVDRFRQHDPVVDHGTGDGDSIEAQYVVRYEGTVYWADVYAI
ncbi:MAG: hypothetical protein ABEI96_10300 [Haloarculaceae archaeon]